MTIVLREYESFFRVTTWREWYEITKSTIPEYAVPWLVSNLVGVVLVMTALRAPNVSRKVSGFLLCIVTSIVNTYFMLTDPTSYQEMGVCAVPPMQRFIYSRFFARPAWIVLPIALCQGLTGIELLFDNSHPRLRKVALASNIVFFFGLTTLGICSAFPSSLLYAIAMKLCWPSDTKSKLV